MARCAICRAECFTGEVDGIFYSHYIGAIRGKVQDDRRRVETVARSDRRVVSAIGDYMPTLPPERNELRLAKAARESNPPGPRPKPTAPKPTKHTPATYFGIHDVTGGEVLRRGAGVVAGNREVSREVQERRMVAQCDRLIRREGLNPSDWSGLVRRALRSART